MMDNRRPASGHTLALIGMEAVSPDYSDLTGFGRRVYRGQGRQDHPQKGSPGSIGQVILRAVEQAEAPLSRIHLIALSPISAELLPKGLQAVQMTDASSRAHPLWSALGLAERLLEDDQWEAVVIAEHRPGARANAAVVVSRLEAARRGRKRIYASVFGMEELPVPINHQFVNLEYRAALKNAGLAPEEIGLLVSPSITSSGLGSSIERGLCAAYDQAGEQNCALGSTEPGLLGLIKAAWCVYWRVIPGMPEWTGLDPKFEQACSSFYVPLEARTWFCPPPLSRRTAGFYMTAGDGSLAFLFLGEEQNGRLPPEAACRNEELRLFPIAGRQMDELLLKIRNLKQHIQANSDLGSAAEGCFTRFLAEKGASALAIGLLAHTPVELVNEADFALRGLAESCGKQQEWQTPLGSYFTPSPLGDERGVAFVYPGAFNAYPGAGQDLFYLFPGLYDRFAQLSSNPGEMLCERKLYPRSLAPLSKADLRVYEEQLVSDPLSMLISGTSLAVLHTILLRDLFKLQSESAFGYSLGEISMLFSSRAWAAAEDMSRALRKSELFRTRLAGPQNAVRSYWGLPLSDPYDKPEPIWENVLLIASPERVNEAIAAEPHVYLTHINTPGQVVIGGDPQACRRVVSQLKAHSIRAPFTDAIHNPAILSEFNALVDLFSWPVESRPAQNLFFSAASQPVQYTQEGIAALLAQGLCTCLDFPALIRQAYQGGARIFVELGAGSSCTRWIHDTLKGSTHAAFAVNQKGAADYTALLRLFARLLSHRVPIDIHSIYKSGAYVS